MSIDETTVFESSIISVRPNSDKASSLFLYYYFSSSVGLGKIRSIAREMAVSGKTGTDLANIVIKIPPIEEQHRIADTLSALDDKIELNRQMNATLEQMAQVLFQSWFIDFEPFDGKMPKDWQRGLLGQFVDIKRGGSPRPIQNFLSNTGLRWLKISDVTALQTPFVLGIKEHIKESGSLVLSNSTTPGVPKILGVDTCIHDGWLYFPSSLLSNEYLYLFFKHIRQNLVALGNGSIFTNLKTDILKNYAVNMPDAKTLQKFDKLVAPLFKIMENRTRESAHLADLRDSLLPRLMSGELAVGA
jgi:type I restriction enzyme S subunit